MVASPVRKAAASRRLVPLAAIEAAAKRLRPILPETPLLDVSRRIDRAAGRGSRLLLKCENFQPIGAFKIRGAYNMVARLSAAVRNRGVLTYSSGNHGQAVAMAAAVHDIAAVVVMPTTAPQVKIDGVRRFGAEVIFHGTTSAERRERGEQEAAARGVTVIPPFDHLDIIAGQGTIGLEILAQCPRAAAIYVPVGGGGLVAGVGAAVKRLHPAVRVIGVQTTGSPAMHRSLAAGRLVAVERPTSIADGLLPTVPGTLPFAHARTFVDDVVLVDDLAVGAAVRWLFREAKLVVEPSGAVGVAAFLAMAAAERPAPAVAVLSGGNIDPEAFQRLCFEPIGPP